MTYIFYDFTKHSVCSFRDVHELSRTVARVMNGGLLHYGLTPWKSQSPQSDFAEQYNVTGKDIYYQLVSVGEWPYAESFYEKHLRRFLITDQNGRHLSLAEATELVFSNAKAPRRENRNLPEYRRAPADCFGRKNNWRAWHEPALHLHTKEAASDCELAGEVEELCGSATKNTLFGRQCYSDLCCRGRTYPHEKRCWKNQKCEAQWQKHKTSGRHTETHREFVEHFVDSKELIEVPDETLLDACAELAFSADLWSEV